MPDALLPDGGVCRGLAGFFGREALPHEGFLGLHFRFGGVGFHERVNRATDGEHMVADEEDGVVESRLESGDLGLDEAEAAQEVVLGDEVRQGDALREKAGVGFDGFEGGIDESAGADAEFRDALALEWREVGQGRQAGLQLRDGLDGEFQLVRRERGALVGIVDVRFGGLHREGGRVGCYGGGGH